MMIPNGRASGYCIGAKGQVPLFQLRAAGSNAIGDAFRLLQLGKADAMVCGGQQVSLL